jgi:hypothetical protein
MRKLIVLLFAFVFCWSTGSAQEGTVRVRYDENIQRLVVYEKGYSVLSYDMYLCPAYTNEEIGPCLVSSKDDNLESIMRFYDKVHPGDKVKMKNIRVLNVATKKVERVRDYSIVLR